MQGLQLPSQPGGGGASAGGNMTMELNSSMVFFQKTDAAKVF